ncbi:MAG: Unknown protein [uncultured Sulfurovum sp.]|uniref:Uncharacterized protein n=1 Tax=uncultured Sulfurovum sp. TaxID=269237 RepID=A0A6S6SYQ9_9BACT|nr:MAG: Unknown protein [uncultured Sulfurovum sp.]
MKWKKWLENWDMTSLKIKTPFLDMEFKPQEADKAAAWDLYIELLTRITTQPLPKEHGDEQTALNSVFALFALTRDVLKKHGRDAEEFSKIAIVVLNQVIRPFTAKWHKESIESAFENGDKCNEFREELKKLQLILGIYTQMLSDMAGVEDLTRLEDI